MATQAVSAYETIYILKPSLSEADTATIHQKVDAVVGKFQGQVTLRDDWGLKEMAYAIDDEGTGRYALVQYTGAPGVVEEIERHFKISPDVMRFMTIRTEKTYDYAKITAQILHAEEEVKKAKELRKKGQ